VARPGTDAKSVGPKHRPGREATRSRAIRLRDKKRVHTANCVAMECWNNDPYPHGAASCRWRDPAALPGRPGHPAASSLFNSYPAVRSMTVLSEFGFAALGCASRLNGRGVILFVGSGLARLEPFELFDPPAQVID
jgi:hypothetical protein